MRARFLFFGQKATVSLIFVLLFLSLASNTEVFQYSRASETINDELKNNDGLTQNKDDGNITDSNDNKESNVACFRLLRDGKTPVSLETSIVTFQGNFTDSNQTTRSVAVDLIGAIHFAEPSYYDELNRIFQEYDVVVFEMVVSAGTDFKETIRKEREEKKSKGTSILNIVPFTQETLANALGFRYQIDGVDYCAPNLKRGDADVEEFLAKLISNGDLVNFCLSALIGAFLNESNGEIESWALVMLCAKDKRLAGRRLLALNLESSDKGKFVVDASKTAESEALSDDDALIAFRNQKALDVVRRELKKGKTKIAIFYGAAHLPDFARRLEQDFGMKQTSETRWTRAWNMEK